MDRRMDGVRRPDSVRYTVGGRCQRGMDTILARQPDINIVLPQNLRGQAAQQSATAWGRGRWLAPQHSDIHASVCPAARTGPRRALIRHRSTYTTTGELQPTFWHVFFSFKHKCPCDGNVTEDTVENQWRAIKIWDFVKAHLCAVCQDPDMLGQAQLATGSSSPPVTSHIHWPAIRCQMFNTIHSNVFQKQNTEQKIVTLTTLYSNFLKKLA